MRRRAFIGLLGGAAAWSFAARAADRDHVKTIGVIINYAETDPEGQARFSALREQLQRLGWTEGSDIRIEPRWAAGRPDLMLAYAAQFVSQPADIIVANSTPLLAILKSLTSTIPIVFTQVADPVGSGFVSNYARPGGNITGFTDFDVSIAGKWIEVLKAVVPSVNRMTVLLDPGQLNHGPSLRSIQSAAPTSKVQISVAEVHSRAEIEQAITSLAGQADSGLIVLPGPLDNTQRDLIIQSTARFHVPAVYPFKYYAKDGGLVYYGINQVDQWAKAAGYVDRILRGENPSELPLQSPTKFELVINLKTAKALGIDVSPAVLSIADGVIE